jgi:hypothetical protein
MKTICLICWIGLIGACATQQGPRASCEGRLRAINDSPLAVDSPDRAARLLAPLGEP